MLIKIPGVLAQAPLQFIQSRLAHSDAWTDGRVTAGFQGAPVKANLQLVEQSALARELGDLVLAVLERHPRFISAGLPLRLYPPMFNRYDVGMQFGSHVDGAIRIDPQTGQKLRTDLSATLFLSDPADYDGGELEIVDQYGTHTVKLAAGDMVLYPASSVHRVTPVTRGARLACFFWVQSMVRDDARRALLFDLDQAIQTLHQGGADADACTTLVGTYHNLVRMWGDAS